MVNATLPPTYFLLLLLPQVPEMAFGEYWDTCEYTDGVLNYNQVGGSSVNEEHNVGKQPRQSGVMSQATTWTDSDWMVAASWLLGANGNPPAN